MDTYDDFRKRGDILQTILEPLVSLDPRERQIFMEYHYFKTHMKVLARSHKISLGRTYELLYRAEGRLAEITRTSEEAKKDSTRKFSPQELFLWRHEKFASKSKDRMAISHGA